jgi:hypothetical protein
MGVNDRRKYAGERERFHEVCDDPTLSTENENANFVMPAWMAGIQIRKDASGNVHVGLDSSTPCWNDAIEWALLEVTEVLLPRIYKQAIKFLGDIFADLPHSPTTLLDSSVNAMITLAVILRRW